VPASAEAAGDGRPPARQQQLFGGGGVDEDLVQEAIEVVLGTRRATATLLQRKLRIDYDLALEVLSELAARGVVALEGDATQGRVVS
jgi:S-DNA-T family DNA segregation ATPase FtsK/SpoIIIE